MYSSVWSHDTFRQFFKQLNHQIKHPTLKLQILNCFWENELELKIELIIGFFDINKHGCNNHGDISSDKTFFKILKKPSIVQEKKLPHMKVVIFIEIKQNKKIRKTQTNKKENKMSFSSSANSQYFFAIISGIGPWVTRINWCKGNWWG